VLSKVNKGFSLVELIVVIAIIGIIAGVIIPIVSNVRDASQLAIQSRNIQTWNQIYTNACAADSTIASVADWSEVSNSLEAGVTANVGDKAVTFACQKPQFINAGNPTFVPGKGITAAP
jgi:prepilin-type N-terminal cleavage/methylation domain-containing protein